MATDILSLLGSTGGLGGLGGTSSTGRSSRGRNSGQQRLPFSGQGGLLGFGTPEYLAGIAGQGIGGWGGQPIRSTILSAPYGSHAYKEGGGDQLRSILSGYGDTRAMQQLTAEHRPGDVILSDQERGILADQNAQRVRDMANQWLTDHPAPAEWIDYGITTGDAIPGQGPLGTIQIPTEWQDAYNAGLQANRDFWSTRQHGTDHLNPGNFTSSAFDPVLDYNNGLRNPNSFEGAQFQIESLINQGRALSDPNFVVPDQNAIESYAMNRTAVLGAANGIGQAMQQFTQPDTEAATRNQQAYDVLLNKGQEGGIIPADYSKPFYGQITGQEGVGGQGGTWNGQSLGWSSGYGGLGLGQSSTTPYWQQGGMQQRDDTPTAGWGGVFGQKNPWSFA